MSKTLLSLLLSSLACYGVFAQEPDVPIITPREQRAEIQSFDTNGFTESPDIQIFNTSQNCVANAADFGQTDKVAITLFIDSQNDVSVVQIYLVKFNDCPLYFGRVKNLRRKTKEPLFFLLGVSPRSDRLTVSYEGLTIKEQVERLTKKLQSESNSSNQNPATSLVLNTL